MSAKQDRTYPRTASDIERKYNFLTRFSEILGIANDAQDAADRANDAADRAQKAVSNLNDNLNQVEIFNRLTNNGTAQGLFIDPETGEIYINAAYIAAGILSSADGKIQIDLGGGDVPVFNTGISTNGLVVRADEADAKKLFYVDSLKDPYDDYYIAYVGLNGADGSPLIAMSESTSSDGPYGSFLTLKSHDDKQSVHITANKNEASLQLTFNKLTNGRLLCRAEGMYMFGLTRLNDKNVSWKDNGDGTYSLVGTD